MHPEYFHSMVFYTLFTLVYGILAHHDPDRVCSVKQPSGSQVCISVKFPWKENPVFFCTDYTKINFTPQCTDPNQSHHCYDDGRNDTLKIATPWDCCPLISTPNRCANVECPTQPFNRTCKEIKVLGACCPTYFCDSGEPDNCKMHRLKSSCVNPPRNKSNCIAFRDPFGCCNKYQCEGDGKPGVCPTHAREIRRKIGEEKGVVGRTVDSVVTGAKRTVNKVATTVKTTLEKHGGSVGKTVSKYIPVPFQQPAPRVVSFQRCTGDHTCPGTMKCCSRGIAIIGRSIRHHKVHQENVNGVKLTTTSHTYKANYYKPNNLRNKLVDGVCIEPDLEGTISHETSSHTPTDKDYISSSAPPATEAFSPSSTTQNIPQDLSTPPNQFTEIVSQTNPTITVTPSSLPTTASIASPTPPPPSSAFSITETPTTTPTVVETTFPSTIPPIESTMSPTLPPTTSTTTSAPGRAGPQDSGADDKNTIVHE